MQRLNYQAFGVVVPLAWAVVAASVAASKFAVVLLMFLWRIVAIFHLGLLILTMVGAALFVAVVVVVVVVVFVFSAA